MSALLEFLTAGTLGPLHHGMAADEVAAALGQPEAESVSRKPRVWKYGALQLALHRTDKQTERLTSVSMYFHSGQAFPPCVRFVEAVPRRRDELAAFLASAGIVPVSDTTDPADEIRLTSGVSFTFDEGALDSIHCSWPRSAGPPRKQLTVSLPLEVYAELQARATHDRRSVAALAAALLEAGARPTETPV